MPEVLASLIFTFLVFFCCFFSLRIFLFLLVNRTLVRLSKPGYYTERDEAVVLNQNHCAQGMKMLKVH